MRLLTSLATLLAAASTISPVATACGFIPHPTVFRLASHEIPGGGRRAFVVLSATPRVAALEAPAELTLVGSSGTRVVSSAHETALATLEIPLEPRDDFAIALPGHVTDATWHEINWTYGMKHPLAGTDLTIAFASGGFAIRRGSSDVATVAGTVLGALDLHGRRYIVAEARGEVTTTDIGAVAIKSATS